MFIKLLGIVLACFVATLARAEGVSAGMLWLQTGGFSYHLPHDGKHNEVNLGLGLEYQWTPNTAIEAGVYKNSFSVQSKYLFVQYHPWEIYGVRFGGTGGLVTGYRRENLQAATLVILPSFSKQWEHVGVDGIFLPSIGGRQGVFWLGFKFPLNRLF